MITINGTETIPSPTIIGGTINSATIGGTTPGAVYSVRQVTTHAATEAATSATMYGNSHLVTGAFTVTLPAAVIGMHAPFRATTAAVMTLDCNGADHFTLGGTALAAGNTIDSDGSVDAACEVWCEQANTWTVKYPNSVFVDGGAA